MQEKNIIWFWSFYATKRSAAGNFAIPVSFSKVKQLPLNQGAFTLQ